MRYLAIVLALGIFPINVLAGELEGEEKIEAIKDSIEDHMACYSYFKIIEMGFNGSGKTDSAKQYSNLADEIAYRANVLSTAIGGKQDSLIEKLKLYQTELLEKMNYDFNNFSVLENEYSQKCTDLYNNTKINITDGEDKNP